MLGDPERTTIVSKTIAGSDKTRNFIKGFVLRVFNRFLKRFSATSSGMCLILRSFIVIPYNKITHFCDQSVIKMLDVKDLGSIDKLSPFFGVITDVYCSHENEDATQTYTSYVDLVWYVYSKCELTGWSKEEPKELGHEHVNLMNKEEIVFHNIRRMLWVHENGIHWISYQTLWRDWAMFHLHTLVSTRQWIKTSSKSIKEALDKEVQWWMRLGAGKTVFLNIKNYFQSLVHDVHKLGLL